MALRATDQQMHRRLRLRDRLPHQRNRTFAVAIGAVAGVLLGAGLHQCLQQTRVRAFAVVVAKTDAYGAALPVHHNPLAACATARNSARPLFIVSCHSRSGSES